DGTRIGLLINVAGPEELDHLDPAHCDGIGLMRSEFLFRDGKALPDEEMQYRAYRRFLEWAGGKPVTIRTLDIGGDKPIKALAPELLASAAFFSIGSNDLTQYVMAVARDEHAVASLGDPSHPAVLRLIAHVARYGAEQGIEVSLCGDMAGDPRHVPALIAAG